MSWIGRSVEEVLANAAEAGRLDTPELRGRQLDLDTQRNQGWWADQFTRRELSHDRRRTAHAAVEQARIGFWRATTIDELRGRVRDANDVIVRANINLVEADRLESFDRHDVEDRWRRLRQR